MTEQFEYAKLTVDAVILKGLDADLGNDNAVSKNYVDLHITSAINALVDGAVPAMDTLKELGVALNNASGDLASSLVSQITAVNSAITAEAASRSASDATQATNFDNEKTLRDGYRVQDRAEAKQMNDVEILERQALDEWLNGGITGLRADAVQDRLDSAAEYQAIAVRRDAEQTARQGAVGDLNFLLSEESSSRVSADNSMNAKIDDEVLVRTSEVARIEANINDADLLINERLNTLGMNLENEGISRNDADVELSTRCDNLVTSVFNEKSERKSEDVLIRASIVAVNEDLVAESAERASAVSALQSSKFDKSGGSVSGDVKLVDSFLNFGDSWRVKASGDGLRIVFEHL